MIMEKHVKKLIVLTWSVFKSQMLSVCPQFQYLFHSLPPVLANTDALKAMVTENSIDSDG